MKINPNRSIEEMFHRPKSKWLRRLRAKYVVYIEILGFLFVALMIAAILFLSFWPNEIVINAKDSGKLRVIPRYTEIKAPKAALAIQYQVNRAQKVLPGEMLIFTWNNDSTRADTLRAEQEGYFFPDSTMNKNPAFPQNNELKGLVYHPPKNMIEGQSLGRIVDFNEFRIDVRFEDAKYFTRLKPGVRVYLEPEFKGSNQALLSLSGSGIKEIVQATILHKELKEKINNALIGSKVTGRDKEWQYTAFEVEKVKDVNIIAEFHAENAVNEKSSLKSDSLYGSTLEGKLDSGHFMIELELTGAIPEKIRKSVEEDAQQLSDKVVEGRKGIYRLHTLDKIQLKVKVQASLLAGQEPFSKGIPGGLRNSNLTEKWFQGTVVLENPPLYVQESAIRAYTVGETLVTTARCVVDTMSWAALLFKKK